jgi:hypothetical protein
MSVGTLDRAATQPPLTRLGLEELDPVQPTGVGKSWLAVTIRRKVAATIAPLTHSQAVTDLTPCPRRWPLCSHPALGGRRAVAHLARTTVGICNSGQDCALEDAVPVLAGHQRLSQHGLSKMPLLVIEGERRLAKTVLISVTAGDRGRAKLGQNCSQRCSASRFIPGR